MSFDNSEQLAESVRSSLNDHAPDNWEWENKQTADDLIVWRTPIGAVDVLIRAEFTGPETVELEAVAEIRCATGTDDAEMRREVQTRKCSPAGVDLEMTAGKALDEIAIQVIELAVEFGEWAVAPDSETGPDFSGVALPDSFKEELDEVKSERADLSQENRQLQSTIDTLADARDVSVASVDLEATEGGEPRVTVVTSPNVDEKTVVDLVTENLAWVDELATDD